MVVDQSSSRRKKSAIAPISPRLQLVSGTSPVASAEPDDRMVLPKRAPSLAQMLAPNRVVPKWEQGIPEACGWREAWEGHRLRVLRRTRNPHEAETLQNHGTAVKLLAQFLVDEGIGPLTVSRCDIEDFFVLLRDRHRGPSGRLNSTPNNRFRALRAFFNELVSAGVIESSPMAGLNAPEVEELRDGRPLEKAEVLRLLKACVPDASSRAKLREAEFRAVRDRALIALLAEDGVRIDGLLSATVAGVDLVERSLRIRLKGGRPFKLRFSRTVVELLEAYLDVRSRHRHEHLRHLWLGERGSLTATGVRRTLKVRAEQAGLELIDVYAHVFRYGIVDHLLAEEVPETLIAAVTGHVDTRMIKHYARARADRLAGATLARHSLVDELLGDDARSDDILHLTVVG